MVIPPSAITLQGSSMREPSPPDPGQAPRDPPLPIGYRQGLITAITVLLGFALIYLRYVAFEGPGAWNRVYAVSTMLLLAAILVFLFALWRALQVADDKVGVYNVTVRWFVAGVGILGGSLIIDLIESFVRGPWE